MSETKHTPGPWTHTGETGDGKRQFVESDMSKDNWNCFHAEIDSDDCNYEMAVANAKLIAAAPELLDACKAMIATWEAFLSSPSGYHAYRQAKAAIAKATGGQP